MNVVTFKWRGKPGYRSTFGPGNVNALHRMVRRHYARLGRFICVTDDATGLDPGIEVVPLWDDHAHVPNPTWPDGPSCYRRLKVFSREFGEFAGPRFACMDLDCVITSDISPLLDRPGDFLIWRTGMQAIPLCASMFVVQAGSQRAERIWTSFDPERSPAEASRLGFRGSDQAWITRVVGREAPGWSRADGVYAYFEMIPARLRPSRRRTVVTHGAGRAYGASGVGPLPQNARIVFFTGKPDPWDAEALTMSPWIEKHYG